MSPRLRAIAGARNTHRVRNLLTILLAWFPTATAVAQPLRDSEFHRIGESGFGDRQNSYAWSMAHFNGKIYIGSNRNFLCAAPLQTVFSSGERPEIPVYCEPDLLDMDMRARIFTYDHRTRQIEIAYTSPTIEILLSDGRRVDVARDHGYRSMVVFREPDGTDALYVSTMVSPRMPGNLKAAILRSTDGRHFEQVPINVSATARFTSFRAMAVYDGRLFAITRSPNASDPGLLELRDPRDGFFGVANSTFGDPAIQAGFEMAVFKGYLYIGTYSGSHGFQLLKTLAKGNPPYIYHKVLADGAYRGELNQSVVSLAAHKDQLYVGTGVFFGSIALDPDFRPPPAEIIRVNADDSWELVVGDDRPTPDGYRVPVSGISAGFRNGFTNYMWRMVVHDGVLYVSTLDTAVFAQYADSIAVEEHPALADFVEQVGPQVAEIITVIEGGFDLWATTNGIAWTRVTRTGFNDEFSYGLRDFVSMPYGLFAGTANPFLGFRFYIGQRAGTDSDGDGHPDISDNCPLEWNLNQADTNGNGIGDVCDIAQPDGSDEASASRLIPPLGDEPPPSEVPPSPARLCGAAGMVLPMVFCYLALYRAAIFRSRAFRRGDKAHCVAKCSR